MVYATIFLSFFDGLDSLTTGCVTRDHGQSANIEIGFIEEKVRKNRTKTLKYKNTHRKVTTLELSHLSQQKQINWSLLTKV